MLMLSFDLIYDFASRVRGRSRRNFMIDTPPLKLSRYGDCIGDAITNVLVCAYAF